MGDFATVGVAVAVETTGEVVTRAGIGLTGVGSATIGATAAGAALVGKPLNGETIEEASALAAEASSPGAIIAQRDVQAPHRPHVRDPAPEPGLREGREGGLT